MGNVRDYLRWRGDLPLAEYPFNLVDNLVLAALSNVDLDQIVPELAEPITVAEASERLRAEPVSRYDPRRLVFVPTALVHDLAQTVRFRDARLSRYVDVTDAATGVQFAAITVALDDGTSYVAFRGTDTSISGWREDFVMSFDVMPSQPLASRYVKDVLASSTGTIRIGGHSKGGNLALHAASQLTDDQLGRVKAVYSNDGPGLAAGRAETGRELLQDRVVRIGPPFSIIGMLFNDQPPDHIVASSAQGIMQHDIMTWQVLGTGLVELPALAPRAVEINQAIADWLSDAPNEERRQITAAVFDSLSAGGAELVQDVARSDFGGVESVLLSLARSRGQLRSPVRSVARTVSRTLASLDWLDAFRSTRSIWLILLGLSGFFLIRVPDLGAQVLAAIAVAGLGILIGFRLIRYFVRFQTRHRLRWQYAAGAIALVVVSLALATQINALIVPANLFIGASFVVGAWTSARSALTLLSGRPRRIPRAVLYLVNALAALLFGIVAFTTADEVLPFYIQQAGQYLLIVSVVGLFLLVHDRASEQLHAADSPEAD